MLARSVLVVSLALSSLAACSASQDAPPSPASDAGPPDRSTFDAEADAGPTGPVQMNDVSILFPLPSTQAEYDAMLTPSSTGTGGVLLPQSLYESATGIVAPPPNAGPSFPDVLAYPGLRLVALRLDPCFAQVGPITDPSSCQNQLRLIFQPVALQGTPPEYVTFDGAVHAFYSLTRAELLDVVQAIGSLRAKTRGTDDLGPLAVHPILMAEGLTGGLAKGLDALVARYAGQDRLVRFTLFEVGDVTWTFRGFDVAAAGGTEPMVIPTLPNASTQVQVIPSSIQEIPNLTLQISPATTSTDDITLLTNAAKARSASAAQVQAAYDSALRIENPNFHSPNTIDCASCHLAGPSRTLVGEGMLALSATGNADAYAADSKYVPAADTAVTTKQDTAEGGLNLHAFSYVLRNPLINQRTINETAAIVAYLRGDP